jgi:hypothetical protein
MRNMSSKRVRFAFSYPTAVTALLGLCCVTVLAGAPASASAAAATQADELQLDPVPGPGTVIVHTKFGGQILGYDIDQSGSEGLLSEYVTEGEGKNLVATETFNQTTGNIVRVVAKKDQTQDDYATQGIVGSHVGLVLYQHLVGGNVRNHFLTMNPLTLNKFTGKWTPQIKKNYILWSISHTQGTANVAVLETSLQGICSAPMSRPTPLGRKFHSTTPILDPFRFLLSIARQIRRFWRGTTEAQLLIQSSRRSISPRARSGSSTALELGSQTAWRSIRPLVRRA